MEYCITFMIAMPISTFFTSKCFTIYYSDSCFSGLEVCHVLFRFFHMWCGTRIRIKCFIVIVLVWHFCYEWNLVYYSFCEVVCRLSFGIFLLVEILLFMIPHFAIISFLFIIFLFFLFLDFSFADSPATFFLDMFNPVTITTLWYITAFSALCLYFLQVLQVTLYWYFTQNKFSSSLDVLETQENLYGITAVIA